MRHSLNSKPKLIEKQGEKSHSISELLWMIHTNDDKDVIPEMLESVEPFAKEFSQLSSMLCNVNPKSKLNYRSIKNQLRKRARLSTKCTIQSKIQTLVRL